MTAHTQTQTDSLSDYFATRRADPLLVRTDDTDAFAVVRDAMFADYGVAFVRDAYDGLDPDATVAL